MTRGGLWALGLALVVVSLAVWGASQRETIGSPEAALSSGASVASPTREASSSELSGGDAPGPRLRALAGSGDGGSMQARAPEDRPIDPVHARRHFAHQMEATHRAVMVAAHHHNFDPLVTARIAELLEEEGRAIRQLLVSDAPPRELFGRIESERRALDAVVDTLLTGYQLRMFEMARAGVGDDYTHALMELQR